MEKNHRINLSENCVYLEQNLNPKNVVSHLIASGAITDHDMENVLAKNTRTEQVRELISIMKTRGPDAYNKLMQALTDSEYKYIGQQLETTLIDEVQVNRSKEKLEVNQPKEKLRLVLLGRTGAGKSATGNTILGDNVFESKLRAGSVTETCKVCYNSEIQVIDTPAFFDTHQSNTNTIEEIDRCIGMSAPGAHAFIIVLKITDRFTEEETETIKLIKAKFGQQIMNYLVVVFVRKDDLDRDGVSIQDFLKKVPVGLKHLLEGCQNKYLAFNNKASAEEQMKLSRTLVDHVYKNILEPNGGKCYSNEVYEEAENKITAEVNRRTLDVERRKNSEIKALKDAMKADKSKAKMGYEAKIRQLESDILVQKIKVRVDIVKEMEKVEPGLAKRVKRYFDKKRSEVRCTIT